MASGNSGEPFGTGEPINSLRQANRKLSHGHDSMILNRQPDVQGHRLGEESPRRRPMPSVAATTPPRICAFTWNRAKLVPPQPVLSRWDEPTLDCSQ